MKTLHFLLISYFFLFSPVSAQITFQKSFGGTGVDGPNSVQQTNDGGYIITGQTTSFGAGANDVYLIRTDVNGDSLWTKTYGGTSTDVGFSVKQTTDGGYIIAGSTLSFGAGNFDIYCINTDSIGNILWTNIFGGTNDDEGFSIQQTADGGYIVIGTTNSFGVGDYDVYLIKTDSNGDSLWTKTFGGTNDDVGYSVHQTSDSGFIICGYTESFGAGNNDVYLIKADVNGNLLWSKTFGGTIDDQGYLVQQTTDGGYIISGKTTSFGAGGSDVYLIKTDINGNTLWTKTFGGANYDFGFSIHQIIDGGYIIVGRTSSFGLGNTNIYLIKTDANGDSLWTKTFGGTGNNTGNSVHQTNDSDYIIACETTSFGAGNYDIYLIKTDSIGNSGCNQGNTATIVTSPATQVTSPATIAGSPPDIVTSPAIIVGSGGIVTTLCTTVGITPMVYGQLSMVNLSPNPSPGNFTITFTNAIDRGEVQIFNAYGTKIFTQNIHNTSNTEIHLKPARPFGGNIRAGIYFVKVFDGEKYFSNKIIIQQD